jgi:hypothetical protein
VNLVEEIVADRAEGLDAAAIAGTPGQPVTRRH